MNPLTQIVAFALLPAAAMMTGGGIALWRPPNATWRSAILHFAAGVVFSVVAVELLPDIVKQHAPLEVTIGFSGGVLAMLAVRSLMSRAEEKAKANAEPSPSSGALPLGLLLGIAVDLVVDGLLLGVGFAAGQKEGVLLALALTVEVLALGLATGAQLGQSGFAPPRVLGFCAGLALSFLIGAVAGATLLHNLRGEALELVLSFGLAALLFLVTEELLVEAHEEAETPLLTATFFIGFLCFLILGMVA